ncbi:hypothetical protein K461DRAFT_297091 [Myriangium duriaei CBS 260.36]|uniref:Uncharacterized protein n=1 Tax=Myriangium duriaei CBS 260.36 TaxID=1168546 RepID=A0A9P4MD87_9PEZI|nr:hypothetical protein K461DRAFT_297091 [Myriangium duriaei CBS 260.36]
MQGTIKSWLKKDNKMVGSDQTIRPLLGLCDNINVARDPSPEPARAFPKQIKKTAAATKAPLRTATRSATPRAKQTDSLKSTPSRSTPAKRNAMTYQAINRHAPSTKQSSQEQDTASKLRSARKHTITGTAQQEMGTKQSTLVNNTRSKSTRVNRTPIRRRNASPIASPESETFHTPQSESSDTSHVMLNPKHSRPDVRPRLKTSSTTQPAASVASTTPRKRPLCQLDESGGPRHDSRRLTSPLKKVAPGKTKTSETGVNDNAYSSPDELSSNICTVVSPRLTKELQLGSSAHAQSSTHRSRVSQNKKFKLDSPVKVGRSTQHAPPMQVKNKPDSLSQIRAESQQQPTAQSKQLKLGSSAHSRATRSTSSPTKNMCVKLDTSAQISVSTQNPPEDDILMDDLHPTDRNDETEEPASQVLPSAKPQSGINISFQSMSSLSTLPPSSQLSFTSSSQRIQKGGEELVTNSSSDAEELHEITEDSASDTDISSEDDLALDIEKLIARKAKEIAARPPADDSTKQEETYFSRESRRHKLKPLPPTSYPSPPKTVHKHSLAAMVKRREKEAAVEARLKKLEEEDRLAEEEFSIQKKVEGKGAPAPAERVAAAINRLDDANGRLKKALDRTDALGEEVGFDFFEAGEVSKRKRLSNPFPKPGQGWEQWMNVLKDPASREHAVPFVAHICLKKVLPLELQKWCLTELLFEEREIVSHAYVGVLQHCAQHEPTSRLLTIETLQDSLLRLRARPSIIYGDDEMPIKSKLGKTQNILSHNLYAFLRFLSALATRLDSQALNKAIHCLALLLIDTNISCSPSLLCQIQSALSALLSATTDLTAPIPSLLSILDSPILTARLISLLPGKYSDTSSALFARLIAWSSFTSLPSPDSVFLRDEKSWDTITSLLQSPVFAPKRGADYPVLMARISLLSTALGPGFSAFDFLHPSTSTCPSAVEESKEKKSLFFAPRPWAPVKSEEQRVYESRVEEVVGLVEGVARRVANGTGSMAQFEARVRADGLALRVGGLGGRAR